MDASVAMPPVLWVCEDSAVNFADSLAAYDEARKPYHLLSEARLKWLSNACCQAIGRLGDVGVLAHAVGFAPSAWPGLPTGATSGRRISRGDVFALADGPTLDLFTASYAFGMGLRGYGPHRHQRVISAATDLSDVLERVRDIGRCQGPLAAYAQLYGGDSKNRARPGIAPWSRIAGFGPAFFTKFLYFSVPGALILDNVMAQRMARLSKMDHFLHNGRPVAWTPYRYAIYLHWMSQTAAAVSAHTSPLVVTPDLLELTLFNGVDMETVPQPDDEGDAAD
jgi:hypothetical protein